MDNENKKKRSAQWRQIEQQVETLLLHWRARIGERIGLEKAKEVSYPTFSLSSI